MTLPTLRYGGACTVAPADRAPALDTADLSYHYPGARRPAIHDVTVRVARGERVALVGPNGAGKSTLLSLILGERRPDHGTIDVFGHAAATCRHRVAVVPQRSHVDWTFPVDVAQVVMMGRYVHLGWLRRPRSEDHDRVLAALERMDIADLARRPVGELSGGQQQRVMIARAIAHDADLLLLDEPLNHVDIRTQELIFHTLEEITAEGKACLVSTHDVGVLTVHFSRALFLDGTVIADGPVDEVLTAPMIARAYGFEFHRHWHQPAPEPLRPTAPNGGCDD